MAAASGAAAAGADVVVASTPLVSDMQVVKDKAVTTLLMMNMQSVFPETTHMPTDLLTLICDYAMPSCAQSRKDHLAVRRAQLDHANQAEQKGIRNAYSLQCEAQAVASTPIITVREALVRYAIDTQVFRGHLLYVPLPNSTAARAQLPKKDLAYRDKRDRLLAQQLFAALNRQRPDLPTEFNKYGPHIKIMVDGLHELYRAMLIRHVQDVDAWIKLLGLKSSCGAKTPEEALTLAEKALQKLTRAQIHHMQTTLRAIHGRDTALAAIVGPRNHISLEVGMRVDMNVIRNRSDPLLEFNRVEQEIVKLDTQVKWEKQFQRQSWEKLRLLAVLLKRCEALQKIAMELGEYDVVADTKLCFQTIDTNEWIFKKHMIQIDYNKKEDNIVAGSASASASASPSPSASASRSDQKSEENNNNIDIGLCPTCEHAIDSFDFKCFEFTYLKHAHVSASHVSATVSTVLQEQWDRLIHLVSRVTDGYHAYHNNSIQTPKMLTSVILPLQKHLQAKVNELEEHRKQAAANTVRLENLWKERSVLAQQLDNVDIQTSKTLL